MRPTVIRLALLAGALIPTAAATAGPAFAQAAGGCSITINGVAIERIDSLSSPLELSATDTLVFAGTDPSSTESARVELVIGPVAVDSGSTTYRPASQEFSATIDLDEVSPYGVGLFRVRGTTDTCTAAAWLRISGRSPFATLTGLTAAGLALGGLTGLLGAVASRKRWSRAAAAAGGAFIGIGGAGLGQEFGRLQLSYPSLAASAAGAAIIGFLLGGVLRPDRSGPTRVFVAEEEIDVPTRPTVVAAAERWTRPATASQPAAVPEPRPEPKPAPAVTTPVPTPTTAPTPYWCYVLAEIDVFDLTDHTRVVAKLRPGAWYLCKREVGGWAHVSTGDGPDGWVAAASIHRQG